MYVTKPQLKSTKPCWRRGLKIILFFIIYYPLCMYILTCATYYNNKDLFGTRAQLAVKPCCGSGSGKKKTDADTDP